MSTSSRSASSSAISATRLRCSKSWSVWASSNTLDSVLLNFRAALLEMEQGIFDFGAMPNTRKYLETARKLAESSSDPGDDGSAPQNPRYAHAAQRDELRVEWGLPVVRSWPVGFPFPRRSIDSSTLFDDDFDDDDDDELTTTTSVRPAPLPAPPSKTKKQKTRKKR